MGCPIEIYAGLASLSEGCPPVEGRLHTCYSPVRQSPPGSASTPRDALRLACVKPAASVHPEPGSNSPLLVIYCYISSNCVVSVRIPFIVFRIDGTYFYVCPCTLKTTFAALSCSKISLFSCTSDPLSRRTLRLGFRRCHFRFAIAKLGQKSPLCKFYRKKICFRTSISIYLIDYLLNQ